MMKPNINKLILMLPVAVMELIVKLNLAESTKQEENEATRNFTVKYHIKYEYLNQPTEKQKNKTEKISENEATIKLHLHSGFVAKVQTALYYKNTLVAESNWTEFNYTDLSAFTSNHACVIYNLTSLNCSWDIENNSPENAQFFISLSQRSELMKCPQYILNQKMQNIGCHMKDIFLKSLQKGEIGEKIKIRLNNRKTRFRTANIEMLNPPTNISLSTLNGNTEIRWYPPPSLMISNDTNKTCIKYKLKLFEIKTDPLVRIIDCGKAEYVFSDLDKESKYAIQIQAKKCNEGKYWGVWSEPVYIGKENESFPKWLLLLIIIIAQLSLEYFYYTYLNDFW
ncbi:interleukin-5 receptor subunit alpha isoform X2 [Bombina bombina]|uniref:interleukin-5 receptor subunit alpha isoform X2 n=1 Tax=Bombina bombina TaxID=8345 RepID=UPI00235AE1F1|nr:interleukin-5 receptor subunit alpha isoform X2 [Bombina bombina]XP_053562400.1 interleukin-5 receptor subunit alpha isoform X2 [Bombina bombina]